MRIKQQAPDTNPSGANEQNDEIGTDGADTVDSGNSEISAPLVPDALTPIGGNHADAMEPYGDDLAMSDQVAVHGVANADATVTAPTGEELPAVTQGIAPVGPPVTDEDEAKADAPDEAKMTTIHAPNKAYDGISAGVTFVKGVGQTDKPEVVEWFRNHGYEVKG